MVVTDVLLLQGPLFSSWTGVAAADNHVNKFALKWPYYLSPKNNEKCFFCHTFSMVMQVSLHLYHFWWKREGMKKINSEWDKWRKI